MYKTKTSIRVRYAETDRMGYVYYGNYAQYFEVARVEALREMGLSYKEMENGGVMLPVLELNIKYFKPAYYDDVLTVESTIKEMPKLRIVFNHCTYNQEGEKLNEGSVTLVFVDVNTKRPFIPPSWVTDNLKKFIEG